MSPTTARLMFVLAAGPALLYLRRKHMMKLWKEEPKQQQHIVDLVRTSCEQAAKELSAFVQIDAAKVTSLAQQQDLLGTPPVWDEFDWHCSRKDYGDELTARYVFVLDALNYCFWPMSAKTGLEYVHLARGLRKACDRGERFTSLDRATEERVKEWLEQPHEFPLLASRVEAIQSLGEAFNQYGDALKWIEECGNSAVRLVDMIQQRLPKFRDEVTFRGKRICFYKRAQILVADLWAAFGQQKQGIGGFYDMDRPYNFCRLPRPAVTERAWSARILN